MGTRLVVSQPTENLSSGKLFTVTKFLYWLNIIVSRMKSMVLKSLFTSLILQLILTH